MKNYIFTTILLFFYVIGFTQTDNYIVSKNWINQHGIKFNSPETPEGYTRYKDCDSCIAFKKVIGDTIIFLTSRSYGAESLKSFSKKHEQKNYNKTFYPKWLQDNGTIIVAEFQKEIFVFRNDSLFVKDANKQVLAQQLAYYLNLRISGKIDSLTYEKDMAEVKETLDIRYPPQFKLIFYKGIFDKSNAVKFAKKDNFLEETVELKDKWELNGKTCYRIKLHTNSGAGDYVFTSDMTFLDMEGCIVGRK